MLRKLLVLILELIIAAGILFAVVRYTTIFDRFIDPTPQTTVERTNEVTTIITPEEKKLQEKIERKEVIIVDTVAPIIEPIEERTSSLEISCRTPWGSMVDHGKQITAYQSSAAYNTACYAEYRTCEDGILYGSYQHQDCQLTIGGERLVVLPFVTKNLEEIDPLIQPEDIDRGLLIFDEDGKRIDVFDDGVLVAGEESFDFAAVQINQKNLTCVTPWGEYIPTGTQTTAYRSNLGFNDDPCIPETRSCINGSLGGSYNYPVCATLQMNKSDYYKTIFPDPSNYNNQFDCTLPWGGDIHDGEYALAYEKGEVLPGEACKVQTLFCNQGTLEGEYTYPDCKLFQ